MAIEIFSPWSNVAGALEKFVELNERYGSPSYKIGIDGTDKWRHFKPAGKDTIISKSEFGYPDNVISIDSYDGSANKLALGLKNEFKNLGIACEIELSKNVERCYLTFKDLEENTAKEIIDLLHKGAQKVLKDNKEKVVDIKSEEWNIKYCFEHQLLKGFAGSTLKTQVVDGEIEVREPSAQGDKLHRADPAVKEKLLQQI